MKDADVQNENNQTEMDKNFQNNLKNVQMHTGEC